MLNAPAKDYIAVARGSDLVVIRVVGRGNMLTAPALADFAEEQRRAGFSRFVFDLEQCKGLDSTFMGTMVGIHTALQNEGKPLDGSLAPLPSDAPLPLGPEAVLESSQKRDADGKLTANDGMISAVNISPELRKLLDMLGVDKFVKLHGNCDLNKLETTMLPEKNLPPDERRELIIKAHENLIEIDKRNEAQFGPLLKSLASELNNDRSKFKS